MVNSGLNEENSFNESKMGLQHLNMGGADINSTNNLKYGFNSPVPTTTQFPTPYSTNQINMMGNQNAGGIENGVIEKKVNSHVDGNNKTGNNDSSVIENSMLPSANNGNGGGSGVLNDITLQPSLALNFNSYNPNGVIGSAGASSNNNMPNEFLLTSPEQFKEFLLESPYLNLNLFNKTPAKTPLRFFAESVSSKTKSSSGNNLFGNVNSNTPLKNLDLNLMFNTNQMAITSSPFGKKMFNEVGTPYAKNLISSNSAFTDFQKARKDLIKSQSHSLQKTPNHLIKTPQTKSIKKIFYDENSKNYDDDKENTDIYGSSPTTIQLNSSVTNSSNKLNLNNIPKLALNGSDLTSTILKNNTNTNCHNNFGNIDERLFDIDMNINMLPLSPTPKTNNNKLDHNDGIKIPELPKMGSFTSERSLSITSSFATKSTSTGNQIHSNNINNLNSQPMTAIDNNNNNTNITTTTRTNNKVGKKTKKQAKFQIIVSNAHRFNTSLGYVPNNGAKSNKKPKLKRTRSLVVGPSKSKIVSSKINEANQTNVNDTTSNNKNVINNDELANDFMNQDNNIQFSNSQ